MEKKITKSNALINASYRFSLNELRLVLYGLSHIDPLSKDFPLFHRVSVQELASFYGISRSEYGSFYEKIKDALVNKFWKREFGYYDSELGELVKRTWLIEIRYGNKNGTLAYHYNPLIKSQLQELASRFTSYFLKNIANMRSAYGVRFYEIAIMYLNASQKDKVVFTRKIDELKNNLGLEEKYKNFFDFRKRVLERARTEVNKHSDIKISYKIIKLGRSPEEIEFTVCRKNAGRQKELKPQEKIRTKTFEQAKRIALDAKTGWDIYAIEQEFNKFIEGKESPKSLDAAFIGFVKRKVGKPP